MASLLESRTQGLQALDDDRIDPEFRKEMDSQRVELAKHPELQRSKRTLRVSVACS